MQSPHHPRFPQAISLILKQLRIFPKSQGALPRLAQMGARAFTPGPRAGGLGSRAARACWAALHVDVHCLDLHYFAS